jgi:cytochrome c55X
MGFKVWMWTAGLLSALPYAGQGGEASPLLPEARRTELQYLLVQDCGSCHGLTLQGGLGPSLRPEALAGKPEAMLLHTILYGRPGTAMPGWQGLLRVEEARWLVLRLREQTP